MNSNYMPKALFKDGHNPNENEDCFCEMCIGLESIRCSMCGEFCDPDKAHMHQGDLIGDECCWDERLRCTE